MSKYREYKQLDLAEIDKEMLAFWESEKVFQKSIDQRDKDNSFVFYEGPPSANGKPGIHHVMARTIKDLFCRYHTMKGKRVERKGGWDTHGLPVELNVEKELGITKEDIGKSISIEEYNTKCRETVMQYKDMWDDITVKMGYWVDLDNPYITFENNYIESVWHLLKKLYDKDLIYKGYTVQPYSPAAGTGLSSHELNLPGCYKEVTDTTVVGMFEVTNDKKSSFLFDKDDEDVRILAWTTTPWTLPSNTALTVGPKIKYVKIKCKNQYTELPISVILAEVLVPKWFGGKKQPEILEQSKPFTGKQLQDIRYKPLLDFGNEIEELNGTQDAFRVITGGHVTTEDGTGVVHTAPSFGADDRMVALKHGIGALTLVDNTGKFKENVGPFSNRYVKNYKENSNYKSVDIDIAIYLKTENKAFNVQKYAHNYPHCWRTDKPILYYPLDSWFVRASKMRDRMAELNKTINWKPASTGTGRFQVWLENLQDWNLSRSRFWGIPLPIWRTADGETSKCIGSIGELRLEIYKANEALELSQSVPEDLHRPYIDNVVLVDDHGVEMKRELDLIDVWFDSGSMPYAQWHFPFENEDKFRQSYPADFISEGVDQTRGWFYTLHAIATMAYDRVSFKNVVSTGLVLDKEGKKMSKSKGNVIDPFMTLDKYGADSTRWYMMVNANPWDNLKFDLEGIDEVKRKFFGTLYNTYSFFALYANLDGFNFSEKSIPIDKRTEIDRWILSLLYSLIKEVDECYADYEPTKVGRLVKEFVEDNLSNWYVRLCRKRFWKGEYSDDKIAAYQTLCTCIQTCAQLIAPIAPFFADWMFKNLNDVTKKHTVNSVHLSDFPVANEKAIDLDLETRMAYAQRISSLVLSLRRKEKLIVRQPLQKILLPILDKKFEDQVKLVEPLILQEVNIKEIDYIEDSSGVINKKIKPNFKTLGKRLGPHMKAAGQIIGAFEQDTITAIEKSGAYTLEIGEEKFDLTLEDFEISAAEIPGWQVAQDKEITLALDVTLTENLKAEGLARELVNRVQNMRKNQDFNVTDRINIFIAPNEKLDMMLSTFGDYTKSEVLADQILIESHVSAEEMELIHDVKVQLAVEKV